MIRIVAALIHPDETKSGAESVTILNASPYPVDLKGWQIADTHDNRQPLSGALQPGECSKIRLSAAMGLVNSGGTITLLNDKGFKVDGVSYTAEQGKKEGWTIVF
jgi:Lamin Tail Domain